MNAENKDKIGLWGTGAALALFILIVTGAVCLALNLRILYYADIRLLDLPEASGLEADVIRENYDALIDYNLLWHRGELYFPTLPMSVTGKIHFAEVKRIFDGIQIAFWISIPVCLVLCVPLLGNGKKRFFFLTGILCIAVPAAALIALLADWEKFFITFHELVFNNDYWWFDPVTDPVIEILPDAFFEQCAVLIVVVTLLCGFICLRLGRRRKTITD